MKGTSVVLGTMLAAQVACMSGPSLVRGSPGDYLEVNSPVTVWATLVDGERLIVTGPRVISDTVFGWAEGEEIAIPVSDLQEIRVRKLSIFRSSILPALLTGGSVAAIILTRRPEGLPPEDLSQTCEETGGICPEIP